MSQTRIMMFCLLIVAGVMIALSLYWLAPVLIPFVLAAFIGIALTPLVDLLMRRLRFPRPLAAVTAMLFGMIVLSLVGVIISASVQELVTNADFYQQRVQQLLDRMADWLSLEQFGITDDDLLNPAKLIKPETLRNLLTGTTQGIFSVFSQGFLVLIFLLFILFGRAVGVKGHGGTFAEVVSQIRKYIVTKVLISSVTGVLVGLILWMLNIKLAMGFGLLAFLLNFIPNIGSIIATLLPLPMVLVNPDATIWSAVLVLALPGAVQMTVGNVIEPKVMGRSFGLHPIVVLMALIFWGKIWGIVGMFLATPVTAILKILLLRIEPTVPVAKLLEGHLGEFLDGQGEPPTP